MQTFFSLYIFIFILTYISCIQFRNKRRYCRNKVKKDVGIEETNTVVQEKCKSSFCQFYKSEESNNHLSSEQCSFDYGMALIINPYTDVREDRTLKSACLKCTACLAVAENLNKSFTEYYFDKIAGQAQDEDCLCHSLQDLCLTGFKNYDLREYNGTKFITKASKHNKHVNSKMDGKWTEFLRNLCKMYIHHMNIHDVFQKYKSGTINFSQYLCNADGIFRDCHNLEMKEMGSINIKSDNNEGYEFAAAISISCFE